MFSGPVCKNTASSPCLLPCYNYQGKEFGSDARDDADGASDEALPVAAEWELTRPSMSVLSVSETAQFRKIADAHEVNVDEEQSGTDGKATESDADAGADADGCSTGTGIQVQVRTYADGK